MARIAPGGRTLTIAAAIALSLSLGACDFVGTRGEGPVTTESRQTDAFSGIESGGGVHVSVAVGPASSLAVEAQGNILPLIVTEVVDGTLRIRSSKGFTTSEPVDVTLTTPQLDRILLSGGSHGDIDGLAADAFDVELNGGSVLTAHGTANTISLGVSGGSVGQLDGLTAATISVDLSGGSRVEVRATDLVDGSATGGSRVSVAGGGDTKVNTTGGSQVEQR
jgi:preprotein translocase subunit YajC